MLCLYMSLQCDQRNGATLVETLAQLKFHACELQTPVTIEMSQMGGPRCRKDNNLHAYMVYMPYAFISVT